MRGSGWALGRLRLCLWLSGQPGTFLFGAGRSGSCAGVARTLLISQCWDGASWARRGGGGGRPQPVPGGGGSSSSTSRRGSRGSSSRGRPAGLPLRLAPPVPGAWRGASRAPSLLPFPSLLPSPPGAPSAAGAARLLRPPLPGREDGPRPAAGLQPQGGEVERGGRAPGPARQHLPPAPDRPAGQRCVGAAGPGGLRAGGIAGRIPGTLPRPPSNPRPPGLGAGLRGPRGALRQNSGVMWPPVCCQLPAPLGEPPAPNQAGKGMSSTADSEVW